MDFLPDKVFVDSVSPCMIKGCEYRAIILNRFTGHRFCLKHAPRLWMQEAERNEACMNQTIAPKHFHAAIASM